MMPPRPPTPVNGSQSASPTLLRSNSATLRYQGGTVSSQAPFSSLMSPETHNNMNIGSTSNMSSLLSQSFGNGGLNSGLSGSGGYQWGGINTSVESDPLAVVANGIGYNPSSFKTSNRVNPFSSNLRQNQQMSNASGNQLLMGQQQLQTKQLELQKFQQGQPSIQSNALQQQHQPQQQWSQQYQSIQGGLRGVGPVSFEAQITNNQDGPQQQLQSSRNLNPVDPQQNQIGRGQGPVNFEPQVTNQQMFLHQQQQQQKQQFFQMLRPSSQPTAVQMNLLQQQRILQLQQQQQQQQQLMKATSQQQYESQQQVDHQNLSLRSPKRPVYEPGMGAQQLTQYIYQQRQRPKDNNIKFWQKFVAEFFAPNGKKRWCVSLYGNSRQTSGVFPQDTWHCEICNLKPSRGFQTTVEVLPRLYKIKYDSGTLDDLLYVDMPREYQNTSGQIVLDYAKAIQESVFEQLRVVRDGRLRIVLSPDLKILSWEFCASHHEEIIPRRLIVPQVGQLGAASQKYQASAQNASSSSSMPELKSNCNVFVASARQLARALEVPLVNDLGYTKRYVRCLQISEVFSSMKDLIDYSQETGSGPMESLVKFPCKTSSIHRQPEGQHQPIPGQTMNNDHISVPASSQQQPTLEQNSNKDHNSVPEISVQPSTCNVVASVNDSHGATSTTTLATPVPGLLPQNSMNFRHDNQMNNPSSPYAGTPVQIPSAGSSTTPTTAHLNPPSPFSALTPSSSNNPPQASQNALPGAALPPATATQLQQSSQKGNPNESLSSVEKIIQEIMTSPRFSGMGSTVGVGSVGNTTENINGITQAGSSFLGGGTANNAATNGILNNNSATGATGYGNFNAGSGFSATSNGIKAAMNYDTAALGGKGMPLMPQDGYVNHQQLEFANELFNGHGAVNDFNNFQFDWK